MATQNKELLKFRQDNPSMLANFQLPSIPPIMKYKNQVSTNKPLNKIIKHIYTTMEKQRNQNPVNYFPKRSSNILLNSSSINSTPKMINQSQDRVNKFSQKVLAINEQHYQNKSQNVYDFNEQNKYKFGSQSRKCKYLKNILCNDQQPLNQKMNFTFQKQQIKNKIVNSSKISKVSFGIVQSFAANTHCGNIRINNEDRVSIIYNMSAQGNKKCQFFAIFDGHGGPGCSNYLRDNLYKFIQNHKNFPEDPKLVLIESFQKAEQQFQELACQPDQQVPDFSGSCAIVMLIVDDMCYIANVGDSRAIMSNNNGKKCYQLSRDHKPWLQSESDRIIKNGGKLYKHTIPIIYSNKPNINASLQKIKFVQGPIRIWPGTLNVSRAFGDIQSKDELYGGKLNVIISEPEIKQFKINELENDFIVLGCDGIFDKLKNAQIIEIIWRQAAKEQKSKMNIHEISGKALEKVIKAALKLQSTDNLTVVMITFKQFAESLRKKQISFDQSNFCSEQVILEKDMN